MAKLIYSAIMSLDGYIEDESGRFDWAAPDEEVHAYINDIERSAGTFLIGRKMYEIMKFWEIDPIPADWPPIMRDYAQIWQSAEKIVYSKALETVESPRTRIERDFDPRIVRQLVTSAPRDVTIGGPNLAQHAFQAGLVDECHFYIVPILVGGGKPCLPKDLRIDLSLLKTHHFSNGTVHLHYHVVK